MLALVQQQPPPTPPLPDLYTRKMSLAVLPSSAVNTYNNQHDFPATSPSPSKRPKLSLDTSTVAPTAYGKKATSLRLETLSATSPTVRNTFGNAHEQKGSKLRLTPITTNLSASPESATPSQIDLPTPVEPIRSTSSSGSTSSISTIDSFNGEVPYKLPFNHTSILKNGPIDRRSTQTTSFFATLKPMFPPSKKVGFKAPLTEEIKTSKYTLKHSDIESSASTISTLDLNESKEEQVEEVEEVKEVEVASPQTGDKRESSDEEEEEDNELYPTTPVAGRRKRHRQWRWTLGPAQSTETSSDAQQTATEEEQSASTSKEGQ